MCFLNLVEKLFCFRFHLFRYMLVWMIHAAQLSECIVNFLSCRLINTGKQAFISDNQQFQDRFIKLMSRPSARQLELAHSKLLNNHKELD